MKLFGYHIDAVYALITLNVLVFFAELFDPRNFLVKNFALQPASFTERPWTLITSMFLHGGLDHIFFNMFALFFFGIYVEQIIGEFKLLELYFVGGVVGGLFFVATAFAGLTSQYQAAIGASGAIFALGGALAVLRPRMTVFIFPIPIPMPLYIAVFGFMVLLSFIMPGIAWQGHVGGLAVGAVYGYWRSKREPYSGHLYGMYDR